MQHRKKGRKLSKKRDQRKALLKSLAENLVRCGKIETTEAKAKEIRSVVEKLITKAKRGNLTDRRHASRYLTAKSTKKLMDEIAPKYKERPGGYIRIVKSKIRKSDASPMAIIEFV